MNTPPVNLVSGKSPLRMSRATWNNRRIDWSGYVFILPFFMPFLTFTVVAIIFGSYIAFTDWGIMGAPEWVGLANFKEAFTTNGW